MKKTLDMILAACLVWALAMTTASAVEGETDEIRVDKRVIALHTGDFELPETDISHLGVGDAETIMTDDGRTIDILRVSDGVEVYVDGELVAPTLHDDHHRGGDHEVMFRRVEVICSDDGACEKSVWVADEEGLPEGHAGGHEPHVIVIGEEREGPQ